MTDVPSEPGNPMTDPPKPRKVDDATIAEINRGVDELCSGPEMVADNAEEVEHQLAMQRELRQSPSDVREALQWVANNLGYEDSIVDDVMTRLEDK